jgi:ParB family chromosome partitioning protein
MKGRDALREMMSSKPAEVTPPPRRSSGAIRAMSLDLHHLSEEAAAARTLREALATSEPIIELIPEDIDPSPVADRIQIDQDPAYEELKAAIADRGQQVPILVRPHPASPGRYQIAYGRRRLRAARELGRAVKAIVRPLSDTELIIAQAQENGPRADLSFIERALFATNLLAHGFDKDTIVGALNVDKPELSRLLTVGGTVTATLIEAIGPAPKIGRPRWLVLAEICGQSDAVSRANEAALTEQFRRADTNTRFNIVFAAASGTLSIRDRKSAISTNGGRRVGWLERTRKGIRLSSDLPGFTAFLERRLPALLDEFESLDPAAESVEGKGGQ